MAVNIVANSEQVAAAPAMTAEQMQAIVELRGIGMAQLVEAENQALSKLSEESLTNAETLGRRVLSLLDQVPDYARDQELSQIGQLAASMLETHLPMIKMLGNSDVIIGQIRGLENHLFIEISIATTDASLIDLEETADAVLGLFNQIPEWPRDNKELSKINRRAKSVLKKVSEIRKQKERVAIESLAELRSMVNRYDFNERIKEIKTSHSRVESLHDLKNMREEVQYFFAKVSKMCRLYDQISASAKDLFSHLSLHAMKESLKILHASIHKKIVLLKQREHDEYAALYATAPPAIVNARHPDAMTENMRISCLQEVGAHLGQYAHTFQSGRALSNNERTNASIELETARDLLRSLRNPEAFQYVHPDFERIQGVVNRATESRG